ncbi:MAG TPA: hypothetical protein VMU08_06365 [Rhizomicrobium sp.]|nr:hypothetical protein [Rhizomicrobium sp.]
MRSLFAAVVLAAVLSAPACAQSAMPGQTLVGSTMPHQTRIPHTAVLSQMPHQVVVPQTSMPGDRAGYTPMPHYPVQAAPGSQPQL